MRLIDADDPKLYEKTYIPQDWSDTQEYPLMIEWKDIVDAPTVDAEPVRNGHWIHCKGKSNLWYCSECGEKIMYNPTRKTYGPNKKTVYEVNMRCRRCGAKMSEEESK